jgi:cysteine sulfinate desulfinase/cysteine desulfurase-like protein
VQSFGHTQQMLHKADFISLSAHKLGGPRGVSCLVIRYPNFLRPFIDGGGQEQSLRSGTENTPGIAGFALAAQLSAEIRALGPVNVRAVEEYASTKARFDEMSVQREDLEKAEKDLKDLIARLLSSMKETFVEQFELLTNNAVIEVRGNFILFIVNADSAEAQKAFLKAI